MSGALIAGEFTGGCQCGAVRYRATARQDDAHICHCRMCQKAVGGFFAALVGLPNDRLAWTRGEPAVFASSDQVERGFCRDCGTPLFYRWTGGDHVSVTIGSLDRPDLVPPRDQYGNEARIPWFDDLATLPGRDEATETTMAEDVAQISASNRQHPDHDTTDWPR